MANKTATTGAGPQDAPPSSSQHDKAPGTHKDGISGVHKYMMGLALAIILTLGSFWVASTGTIWSPGGPVLLAALAIGQMGVHLVFFLHISSAPDDLNNLLALAFGVFVVGLLLFGSIIIMWNLNANMMPM